MAKKNLNANTAITLSAATNIKSPELRERAISRYEKMYKLFVEYCKRIKIPCSEEYSSYTFVADMALYIGNTNGLEDYIKKMLDTYCKNNKQAYYEMIISCITMSRVFRYSRFDIGEVGRCCGEWRDKLMCEDFATQYITSGEIKTFVKCCG